MSERNILGSAKSVFVTLPLMSIMKRSMSNLLLSFIARFKCLPLPKFFNAVIYLAYRFYLKYVEVKKQLKSAIGCFKNLASSLVYSDSKISIVLSNTTLNRFFL